VENRLSATFFRAWKPLAALLIVRVTAGVVLNYGEYFPPNFESDFLWRRDSYFFGYYQWVFYAHIVAGPLSLVLGIVLLSNAFRLQFPHWHRYLGRVQAFVVLLVVSPSGLVMSFRAATGLIAAAGFATLSIMTAVFFSLGWYTAAKRQFATHRQWMWRCFLMLCSAVVLRLAVGLMIVLNVEGPWIYPVAAWTSWLVPLTVYEIAERSVGRFQRKTSESGHVLRA
jgi:hypothetical protein